MKQAPPALSKLRAVFDKRLEGGAMNTIYAFREIFRPERELSPAIA